MDPAANIENVDCVPSVMTGFAKCLICQKTSKAKGTLQNVETTDTLVNAMSKRQESVALRLSGHASSEKQMKWHGDGRRWYTLQKSCNLAERRRKQSSCEGSNGTSTSSSDSKQKFLRSRVSTFNYLRQCIICERKFTIRNKASKAMTDTRGKTLKKKATELGDRKMLSRIQAFKDSEVDLVALDIQYHKKCMNAYLVRRVIKQKTSSSGQSKKDAFVMLSDELQQILIKEKNVLALSSVRDRYRQLLMEKGLSCADVYTSFQMRKKLETHFGDKLSFWSSDHQCYVSSSDVTVASVLKKVIQMTGQTVERTDEDILQQAAHILHKAAKNCKQSDTDTSTTMNISEEAAFDMIPKVLIMFVTTMVTGGKYKENEGIKNMSQEIKSKVLNICQQILYGISKIPTPLSLGTAFYLYNETRSKSLIKLMNHMNNSVSYDTFQRFLTTICEQVMASEREAGVFVPPAIRGCEFIHFAMDNADWHERTPDGSTFHCMTTNVYGYDMVAGTDASFEQSQFNGTNDISSSHDQIATASLTGKFGEIPKVSTKKVSWFSIIRTHNHEIVK